MQAVKQQVLKLIALIQRNPGLVAIFGFASGLASFLLVERQAELAQVLALVMLVSWLWLILENILRERIAQRFGFELPPPLLRYATQMIHQESLFFVLPFFFITTTWNSGQLLFSGLLASAALVSIIDPLYYRWLAPKRWLFLAYHTLTLFAVLLTALPIIFKLTTPQSYQLALAAAVVLSFPSLFTIITVQRWWRGLLLVGMTLAIGAGGWLVRVWVPPATLWLTQVAVTSQFDNQNRAPGESIKQLSVAQLRSQGLFAYTAINAPRGLNERIYHVWRRDGGEVERIALDIHGGRKEGYRAWTHKQNFPADAVGRWQVQVLTEAGQMIGVLRFKVVE
ncbi:MAG: DUF2914 domain-containing protein [Gammaproteobacteria bacterium]|jgi:hypothetical protein|nr:DUF2914 domain-containing protein [Gammaproteobacteria bacterium]MBU2255391.1 DUF2914 domain-containing protein [Gammaproteobacteria bacterium]MBU2295071.1 DUF2914 domain-containing protein [Gammaproteobacteria bacterium]